MLCSVVSDSATPWTVVPQAPLSMGFSRQESWSRLPFPTRRDLADPGVDPSFLTFYIGRWVLFHQHPREGWVGRAHRGFQGREATLYDAGMMDRCPAGLPRRIG